jgi:hypothetical protein
MVGVAGGLRNGGIRQHSFGEAEHFREVPFCTACSIEPKAEWLPMAIKIHESTLLPRPGPRRSRVRREGT